MPKTALMRKNQGDTVDFSLHAGIFIANFGRALDVSSRIATGWLMVKDSSD